MVAAEIEKVFETKVNPDTIRKKAERMIGTNVPPETTTQDNTEKGGNTGNNPILKETPTLVKQEIKKGKSEREAVKEVAQKTGLNEGSVRVTHQRAEKKKEKLVEMLQQFLLCHMPGDLVSLPHGQKQ